MKICAVICELNPLHNGHRYIFEKAREATGNELYGHDRVLSPSA